MQVKVSEWKYSLSIAHNDTAKVTIMDNASLWLDMYIRWLSDAKVS